MQEQPQSKKHSLLSRIGLSILLGAIIGLFYIGLDELTLKAFITATVPAIVFTLPYILIQHFFGPQLGIRLALLVIYSCLAASGVFYLFISSTHINLERYALLTLGFTAFMLLIAIQASRSRQKRSEFPSTAKPPTFVEMSGLKTKTRIFWSIFWTFAVLNYVCVRAFAIPSLKDKHDILSGVIVACICIILIDMLYITLFARCPNCHKRVFTFLLAAKGMMPVDGIRKCPHCAFPDHLTAQETVRNLGQSPV